MRSSIPVFKGDAAILLANEIKKWELTRTELVNRYSTYATTTNNMRISQSNVSSIANTPFIRNRAYWAPGQSVGEPVRNFSQIQYLPLEDAVPILDQALSGAWVDCALDLHN